MIFLVAAAIDPLLPPRRLVVRLAGGLSDELESLPLPVPVLFLLCVPFWSFLRRHRGGIGMFIMLLARLSLWPVPG